VTFCSSSEDDSGCSRLLSVVAERRSGNPRTSSLSHPLDRRGRTLYKGTRRIPRGIIFPDRAGCPRETRFVRAVSGEEGDGDDPTSDNGTFRQQALYPTYAPWRRLSGGENSWPISTTD
jgi:hypothetical protein